MMPTVSTPARGPRSSGHLVASLVTDKEVEAVVNATMNARFSGGLRQMVAHIDSVDKSKRVEAIGAIADCYASLGEAFAVKADELGVTTLLVRRLIKLVGET